MPIAVPHPHAIPEFPAVLERSPQLARLSLSRFSHASPELLSKRELLQRVDRKFVVSTSLVRPFLDLLGRTHHLLSQGDEGWARYETCYFDTQKLVSFRDHLRGRRPRFKVRIRHHLGRRKSFLELKTKDAGGRTHKSRRERDFGDTALSPSDLAFLTDAAPTQLGRLQESVWTNFDRATFLGTHEVERITVDCNLAFVRGQREVDSPALAIVEIKQPRLNHRSSAVLALRSLAARESSLSKYCAAVATVHEEVGARDQRTAHRKIERAERVA